MQNKVYPKQSIKHKKGTVLKGLKFKRRHADEVRAAEGLWCVNWLVATCNFLVTYHRLQLASGETKSNLTNSSTSRQDSLCRLLEECGRLTIRIHTFHTMDADSWALNLHNTLFQLCQLSYGSKRSSSVAGLRMLTLSARKTILC